VNQQNFKFGITCGLVGLIFFGGSLPVRSIPPGGEPPIPVGQKLPVSAQLAIDGQKIGLEVARTPNEQSTGLMYRTDLAKDRGMLFVFNPPQPARFWMKNTLIPLDIIFMSNGVVKYIGINIPPCKTESCPTYGAATKIDIDGVLELRAGRAKELNLKVGDRLKITDVQLKG
jgi:uncharacterized protein